MRKEQCKIELKSKGVDEVGKRLNEAAMAFDNLRIALEKMKNKKWWQFWK